MKNFIIKNIEKNRNLLRYILTNPFKEEPFFTYLKFFNDNNCIVVNKKESISNSVKDMNFKIKKNSVIFYIHINISQDHLIKIKIMPENISLTTRNIEDTLDLIKEKIDG